MKQSLFSDQQIVGIFLNEQRGGLSAVALCRKYGVSDAARTRRIDAFWR